MTSRYRIILFACLCLWTLPAQSADHKQEAATFAGGCFWCVEHLFDEIPGVLSTTSGYIDGQKNNPTYKQVSSGVTGHTEAVRVVFDPTKVSYGELLSHFWVNIDPTVNHRQFCDRGSQYRPGLYYETKAQGETARASKRIVAQTKPFPQPLLTEIKQAGTFYPAEEYHQDYHHKNPIRYTFYRRGCGRDNRLKELWNGYDATQIKKGLTP
ncbi:MAG: peptide-methionine (S)-S-oxide reductase MsrA [Magnetococcales bacterium]|nr:peptide-methionine (S)-S-oxide reductase MsrA [Magnetococcales bacterium]